MSVGEEKEQGNDLRVSRRKFLTDSARGIATAAVAVLIPEGSLASGEYRKYGAVTVAELRAMDTTFTPDQVKALSMPVVVDKRNNTKVLVPGEFSGTGFGAFVQSADGVDSNVYWSSLHDDQFFKRGDGSHTSIVAVLHSDQNTLNRTGDFFLAVSDGIHGGVMVLRSKNGGVDYGNTGKSFNYELSGDLNNPTADHKGVMRDKFNQAVSELAGH